MPANWSHDCIGVPGEETLLAMWIMVCPICGTLKEKHVEEVDG